MLMFRCVSTAVLIALTAVGSLTLATAQEPKQARGTVEMGAGLRTAVISGC
jgi:hypothetical protein